MVEDGRCAPVPRIPLEEGGGWILWRVGRRAVIAAAGTQMDALLQAVVDFVHHEAALRALESEVAADWCVAEKYLPLIHEVKRGDLQKSTDLGQITQKTMLRQMRSCPPGAASDFHTGYAGTIRADRSAAPARAGQYREPPGSSGCAD